jgi:hypothetical protein
MKNLTISFCLCFVFLTGLVPGCSINDYNFNDENDDLQELEGYDITFDLASYGGYVVSTDGNDSNPGTYEFPWASWQKAFETARPGDTVLFRGGVYKPREAAFQANITYIDPNAKYKHQTPVGHSGTKERPIWYMNFPGEEPILDCSLIVPENDGNYLGGIGLIEVHYIHFRGLTVRNVYQRRAGRSVNGISTQACSNLTFENMTVHNIGGRAMWVTSICGYYGIETDTTRLINCDFYSCMDSLSNIPGNAADGVKGDVEKGGYLYFEGCRAWNCSDDGFDISGPGIAVFKNCWSFNNGGENSVDGNGFKTGGVRDSISTPARLLIRCIAANNSGPGFYDLDYKPYYRTNARYYNNTSYGNQYAYYAINNENKPFRNSLYINNIAYKSTSKGPDGKPQEIAIGSPPYEARNNTWKVYDPRPGSYPFFQLNPEYNLTDSDFESLDVSQLMRVRKPDGSLPDIDFMKPKQGSSLIDGGIDVGYPYEGSAPDLGAIEVL